MWFGVAFIVLWADKLFACGEVRSVLIGVDSSGGLWCDLICVGVPSLSESLVGGVTKGLL